MGPFGMSWIFVERFVLSRAFLLMGEMQTTVVIVRYDHSMEGRDIWWPSQ
jgi:hypothetical protein